VARTSSGKTWPCCCARCARVSTIPRPPGGCWPASLAALAGYERELIHERAAAAAPPPEPEAATPAARPSSPRQVRALRAGGESISELVAGYGVSRATIYRALAGHEGDQ